MICILQNSADRDRWRRTVREISYEFLLSADICIVGSSSDKSLISPISLCSEKAAAIPPETLQRYSNRNVLTCKKAQKSTKNVRLMQSLLPLSHILQQTNSLDGTEVTLSSINFADHPVHRAQCTIVTLNLSRRVHVVNRWLECIYNYLKTMKPAEESGRKGGERIARKYSPRISHTAVYTYILVTKSLSSRECIPSLPILRISKRPTRNFSSVP